MDAASHWEKVYRTKAPDAVSWYRPHLDRSLALIESAAADRTVSIIDVGGGESTLVDDLLARFKCLEDTRSISPPGPPISVSESGKRGVARSRRGWRCRN